MVIEVTEAKKTHTQQKIALSFVQRHLTFMLNATTLI